MLRNSVFLAIITSLLLISCSTQVSRKVIGIKIYDYDGDFSLLVEKWKQMGINTCFVSTSLASNKEFRKNLRKNKIKVYLIFPVFQNPEILEKDSTLYAVTNKGNLAREEWVRFVCPSRKLYSKSKIDELKDLIMELNPDGISIDFIRHFVYWEMIYPDRNPASIDIACFCDSCLSEFTGEMKIYIPDTCLTTPDKAAFIMNHYHNEWNSYRCSLITSIVKKISEKAKCLKSDIKINVHVVPWREGDFDDAGIRVAGQDLKEIAPYSDYISPMCYSQMLKRDSEWIASVVKDMDRRCPGKILPSIQVFPEYIEDAFTVDDFKDCIVKALQSASSGVVFFSWPLFEKDPERIEAAKEVLKVTY